MAESTNGEVDYKKSYFACLKERDEAKLQHRNDWLMLMAGCNELVNNLAKAVTALEAIAYAGVPFQGDEHNGYYALMDYAESKLNEMDKEKTLKVLNMIQQDITRRSDEE